MHYRVTPARLAPSTLAALVLLAGCGDDGTGTGEPSTGAMTSVGPAPDTTAPSDTTSVDVPTTGPSSPTTTTETTQTTGPVDPTNSTGTTVVTSLDTTITTNTDDTTAGESTLGETSIGESTLAETSIGESTVAETGELCPDGTILCDGQTKKVCDGLGGFKDEEVCAKVCVPDLGGCAECIPGAVSCNGEVSQVCNDEGSGTVDVPCDAVQGVVCEDLLGCTGSCAPNTLGLSYIGCDYYPTVTANVVTNNFNFAVAVANTTAVAAKVRVDQGNATIANAMVPPNGVTVIKLPWVAQLKASEGSSTIKAVDGAYRLRSDQPVTVYQFDPVEYALNGSNSFTNDASLLLPVNAWTRDYFVLARNQWLWGGQVNYPGFYAVTASQDNTTVTLGPSPTGGNVRAGAGVANNGTGQVVLNQGDVLEVFSGGSLPEPSASDLTGTRVTSDKPIQVIGGHFCTFIPHNVGYCDHLEESMPPYETLATTYIVNPPLIPTGGNVPKAHMVRVVATEANTTLSYDPPQNGAPTNIAAAGGYFEIAKTTADFKITADKKILVGTYMQGQDAGGNSGDPAMALAVPIVQYRKSYLFHAPINYEKNYANIVAPTGAVVTLDGAPVGGFTTIGGTGFDIARVALPNNVDGNHDISSAQAIGISVYGYGQYTSYWYPGGLDLDVIPQ